MYLELQLANAWCSGRVRTVERLGGHFSRKCWTRSHSSQNKTCYVKRNSWSVPCYSSKVGGGRWPPCSYSIRTYSPVVNHYNYSLASRPGRSFTAWSSCVELVQEFLGPIINHTGRSRPHFVMLRTYQVIPWNVLP